jgi:hypothetical protein
MVTRDQVQAVLDEEIDLGLARPPSTTRRSSRDRCAGRRSSSPCPRDTACSRSAEHSTAPISPANP